MEKAKIQNQNQIQTQNQTQNAETNIQNTRTMARMKQTAPQRIIGPAEAMLKKAKQRRHRPGTVAAREIKRYQRSTGLLLPKASVARLIREVTQSLEKQELRFQTLALLALQEASEAYLVTLFETADKCRIHAGRQTVMDEDMKFARYLESKVLAK